MLPLAVLPLATGVGKYLKAQLALETANNCGMLVPNVPIFICVLGELFKAKLTHLEENYI